jgi:hypothetical protein
MLCSGYFGNNVSLFAQTGLELDPSVLYFPPLLRWQVCAMKFNFFHWDGVLQMFLPMLSWNCNHPDFSLLCNFGWQACTTTHSYWLRWGSTNFPPHFHSHPNPGWAQTEILQILCSQVARIIGMNHWHLHPPCPHL